MSKVWFRAKRHGLAWHPVSIEGWVASFGYIVALAIGEIFLMAKLAMTGSWIMPAAFLVYAICLTVLFMRICTAKGERLHWRWGK